MHSQKVHVDNEVTRRHGCNTHDSGSNKPSDLHITYPVTTEVYMKIRKHPNYCTYNPPCTFSIHFTTNTQL